MDKMVPTEYMYHFTRKIISCYFKKVTVVVVLLPLMSFKLVFGSSDAKTSVISFDNHGNLRTFASLRKFSSISGYFPDFLDMFWISGPMELLMYLLFHFSNNS